MLNYKAAKNISLKGGFSYSLLLGRAIPLPVIGAGLRFKTGTTINLLLPYYLHIEQKLNTKSTFSLSIKPDGAVYQFANKGNFIAHQPEIQLRLKAFKMGINYAYQFDENIKAFIEGGLMGRTAVLFSENKITDKKTFFNADVENGYYGKAGLIITFGETPQWGKQNGVNFMLDYDVNGSEVRE
jgi:hypothetical protein